jgi:hypothetical protein
MHPQLGYKIKKKSIDELYCSGDYMHMKSGDKTFGANSIIVIEVYINISK